MDAVRQIVDGSALAPIISLPQSLRGRKVEVIVLPVADRSAYDRQNVPTITREQLEKMRAESSATKLTGSIPRSYITIQEIREERLAERYDSFD